MDVVHRLQTMPARVVEAQDRLKFGSRLGKRPEVHGRDPGQAVSRQGEQPGSGSRSDDLPSLVG